MLFRSLRGSPETFWRYVLKAPQNEGMKKQLKHQKDRLSEATSALEYLGRVKYVQFGNLLAHIRDDIAMQRDQIAEIEALLNVDSSKLIEKAMKFAALWAVKANHFIPDELGLLIIDANNAEKLDLKIGLLRKKETTRYALSGAEFNIVITALAIALNDNPSSIVIPDDRAISSLTLSHWLTKLSACKCQIIVTSVARPKLEVPKNFHTVTL